MSGDEMSGVEMSGDEMSCNLLNVLSIVQQFCIQIRSQGLDILIGKRTQSWMLWFFPLWMLSFYLACMVTAKMLKLWKIFTATGKSLLEALIFHQLTHIPSSNLERTCCVQKLFMTFRTVFVHNMFSPCSAKRRASDKDLPVQSKHVRRNAIFMARKKTFTIPMQVQLVHLSLPRQKKSQEILETCCQSRPMYRTSNRRQLMYTNLHQWRNKCCPCLNT